MKSLSLSRPLIIMMVGYPGAGKSFFARQFSETFNAPLVSVDRLRTSLFNAPAYSKEEDQLIDGIISYEINELAKTGKTFIVDGGCNARATRIEYERFARAKGYGTLIIWVQTDERTCKQRALKRNPTRTGDELNVSMSEEAFGVALKRFTAPNPSEASLVISGKHTYAAQLRVVLKKLVPARELTPPEQHEQAPEQRNHGTISPKPRRLTIN